MLMLIALAEKMPLVNALIMFQYRLDGKAESCLY